MLHDAFRVAPLIVLHGVETGRIVKVGARLANFSRTLLSL